MSKRHFRHLKPTNRFVKIAFLPPHQHKPQRTRLLHIHRIGRLIISLCISLEATAQPFHDDSTEIHALWHQPAGPALRIVLLRASPQRLIYRLDQPDAPESSLPLPAATHIEPIAPPSLRAAISEMRAGRHLEARAMFEQLSSRHSALLDLPDNPSTLAQFYAMECSRRLADWSTLSRARAAFADSALQQPQLRLQFQLHALWLQLQEKKWPELLAASEQIPRSSMARELLAQWFFCRAQAQEQQRDPAALDSYRLALAADPISSQDIVALSATAIMRHHWSEDDVRHAANQLQQQSLPLNKAPAALQEAVALAHWFSRADAANRPLPGDLQPLLQLPPPIYKDMRPPLSD